MKFINHLHSAVAGLLLFASLGFIVIPGKLYAQGWQFVTGEYMGTALNGAGTILVAGEHGLIMRSGDNGTTWELPPSNTYETLRDVAFVTPQEALVVGDAGLVLRSEDGGRMWETTTIANAEGGLGKLDVYGNSVWITSHDRLFRSSNGGQTWEAPIALPDTALSLARASEMIGLMVSGDGTLYRTTDGGTVWEVGFTHPDTRFRAIDFSPDGRTGVVGGEKSRVYITRDSGATWTLSSVQDTLLNIMVAAVNDRGIITVGGGLNGWDDNILYTSRDTGSTWEIVRFIHAEDQAAVSSVELDEEDFGIASTNFGMIVMTKDAWQTIDTITDIKNVTLGRLPNTFYNGAIAANNTGIILNNLAPGGYTATTDGGITWKFRQYGALSWKSIERAGQDYLLMFGGFVSEVYRTGDAGKNWTWLGESAPEKISDMIRSQTLDARSVFQLHNAWDKSSGILYYSSDSGKTFDKEVFSDVQTYSILDFITPDIGVIGGFTFPKDQDSITAGYVYGALFLTQDRGRNRKLIYEYSGLENVSGWTAEMVDTNTILLATGGGAHGLPGKHVILKTTDQGENWEVSYTADRQFYDLAAFNDSVWYAVGENAMIVTTSDRGKTWTQENIEPLPRFRFGVVPRFRQVFLLPDDRTGMIIGEGTILRKTFPQKLSGIMGEERDEERNQLLHVRPNPAQDELFVAWKGKGRLGELALFDVLGRKVLTYKDEVRSGETIRVDLSGLPAGTYQLAGRGAEGITMTTVSVVVE